MAEKRRMAAPKGYYFEEFETGQIYTSPGRTVTEADVVGFAALTGDWTRLHTDAVYAAQQPFGQRVAHGMLGLSIASALAIRLGFLEETILALREINNWKFVLPIFLGDTIHMQAVVHETRAVPRLGGGLVTLEIEVLNQDDKVVQRGSWSVLVKGQLAACAPAATPAPAKVPAALPAAPVALPAEATATTAPQMMAEPTINVAADPTLGNILVDGSGMTLYIFTKDTPGVSNCNAGCLAKWPPLLTNGSPKAGPGVDASLFGTATLADGSKMVTYNKMPLYYWVNDKKPGDTTGQNVGKVWFVIDPSGRPVMPPAAPAATPTVAAMAEDVTLNVANDPKLGNILVDGKGMTLYLYKKDMPGVSNCSAGCLQAWPPFVTQGHPTLGAGVDASKVGTATLADGRKIVSYEGRPLYYYANDTKAGDTTGQGVGGVWFVVPPSSKSSSGY